MLLNIAVIAVVCLIAYWWASQGFLSALLHFTTVVAAGAVAFAVWEPISVGLFGRLDNPTLTDMAWGISLMVVFATVVQLLRPLTIRLVPANARLNEAANLAGGAVLGAGAGIISAGIILIGSQFIQGPTEILGATTWSLDNSGTPDTTETPIWLDADQWTSEFYSIASNGSMWMANPLSKWHPNLHQEAGLYRHSFDGGKSRMGINTNSYAVEFVRRADAAAAQRVIQDIGSLIDPARQLESGQGDVYQIKALFNTSTWDAGNKLHIMRPQVRLIVRTRTGEYLAVHPHAFIEPIRQDTNEEGRWLWEDPETAATSVGSPERAPITFEFVVPPQSTISHFVVRQGRKTGADLPQSAEAITTGEIQDQIAAAASVGAAPPGAAINSARPWQGYLMTAVLSVFVIFSNMLPAKRGHQD